MRPNNHNKIISTLFASQQHSHQDIILCIYIPARRQQKSSRHQIRNFFPFFSFFTVLSSSHFFSFFLQERKKKGEMKGRRIGVKGSESIGYTVLSRFPPFFLLNALPLGWTVTGQSTNSKGFNMMHRIGF